LKREAFHGLTGDIVRTIEPTTESDPAALLVQFLVAFGSVIGPHAHFKIEAAKHRANLFCLIVGRSSKARKGTAWAHIRELFERIDRKWTQRYIVSNLSSGEGLIWVVRDPSPNQRPRKNNKQAKQQDEGVRDKRLLVCQSEFASALRIQRREGNILSGIVRQAWESGNLHILTKNSPVKTTGSHISMIGHITQDELRSELRATDEANGYANRFLFVCAERKRLLPRGGRIDQDKVRLIIKCLRKSVWFAQRPQQLEFSERAARLWDKKYERLTAEIPGLLGAIVSRAEAQVLRISMIYALLDRSNLIKTQHLRAALAVWRYCSHSARYIFGGALGDRIADKILQALRGKRDGMSRTEIRNLFKRNLDAERIGRALDFLARHRLAACSIEETQGRPIERWSAL